MKLWMACHDHDGNIKIKCILEGCKFVRDASTSTHCVRAISGVLRMLPKKVRHPEPLLTIDEARLRRCSSSLRIIF